MSYRDVTEAGTVRAELARIVASPVLEDADRLIRFLTFVVEQTLAGNGGLLKESVIGSEVFGRPADYDPKTDPIVRVQARRLRTKLDAWYLEGGRTSAIRIELPKGGYQPQFVRPEVPAAPAAAPVAAPRRKLTWLAPVLCLLLLGASAALLTNSKSARTAPGSRPFTSYPGYQTSPAFSPDGLTLAFSWGGGSDSGTPEIYVQPLSADAPRRLTASNVRERNPVWLPDGQHVAFLRDEGPRSFAVMVAPTMGAGERRVAEIAGDLAAPPRIEWSRDGRKLYTNEAEQIVEIDVASGARRWVAPPAKQGAAATPGDDDVHLSPDGKWLAFRRRTASAVGDVAIVPASGGAVRMLTHDHTGLAGIAWTQDGSALIVSSQRQSSLVRLWRFPVNGRAPVCLTDAALSAAFPAVSPRDGQIAFAARYFNTNIWRIDLAGQSPPQLVVASNLLDSSPRYAPQGDRIAFRSNRTGSDEIWVADAAGRSPMRLTAFGGPVTGSPHWSPDGRYLAFDSRPDGSADIFVIPAGGGQSRKMTAEASNEVTPAFSADGKSLYFASDRTGAWQVWKQPAEGGAARQVTTAGGFAPRESADGAWLYYTKLDRGGVYRVPAAGGAGMAGGGAETTVLDAPRPGGWGGWSLVGAKILYAENNELRLFDPATGKTEVVCQLAHAPVLWDGSLAVSPDGRYALVSEVQRQGSEIHLQPVE